MDERSRRGGRVCRLLTLVGFTLAGGPGCLSCFHTVEPPPPELLDPCRCLPQCCKSRVHVFLIDGLDPLNAGALTDVRAFLIDVGFIKTSLGQVYHAGSFGDQIRKLHRDDPEAQFALVGFDRGARSARALACELVGEGVPVALVVFLDGQFLEELPPQGLPGTRVVHVRNAGGLWDVPELKTVENVNVQGCEHFQLPTHPLTLEVLASGLAAVTQTVPMPALPIDALPPSFEPPPPPRPIEPPGVGAAAAGWDFLRATDRLPPADALPVPQGQLTSGGRGVEVRPAVIEGRTDR
jgi:hypothetical protein